MDRSTNINRFLDQKIANGRFIVKQRLGSGSFGEIFSGVDLHRNNKDVAIKLEPVRTRHPQLLYESKIYRLLHTNNTLQMAGGGPQQQGAAGGAGGGGVAGGVGAAVGVGTAAMGSQQQQQQMYSVSTANNSSGNGGGGGMGMGMVPAGPGASSNNVSSGINNNHNNVSGSAAPFHPQQFGIGGAMGSGFEMNSSPALAGSHPNMTGMPQQQQAMAMGGGYGPNGAPLPGLLPFQHQNHQMQQAQMGMYPMGGGGGGGGMGMLPSSPMGPQSNQNWQPPGMGGNNNNSGPMMGMGGMGGFGGGMGGQPPAGAPFDSSGMGPNHNQNPLMGMGHMQQQQQQQQQMMMGQGGGYPQQQFAPQQQFGGGGGPAPQQPQQPFAPPNFLAANTSNFSPNGMMPGGGGGPMNGGQQQQMAGQPAPADSALMTSGGGSSIGLSFTNYVVGIPEIHYFGVEGDYNVMVIDLCGPSLEDLFCYCGRKFSLKTICLLADQLLHRIQFLHSKYLVHRDLKPENFVMGVRDRAHHVNLIDYGLSKRYWDTRNNQHAPYMEGKPLTGTARYCSVNTHLGIEQSRRDDLESIGYIILYFYKGSLPWQGIRAVEPSQKTIRIGEKKISIGIEYLCRDEPPPFMRYMRYCRGLRFEETPDYLWCRRLFSDLAEKEGLARDWVFDWVEKRQRERALEESQSINGSMMDGHGSSITGLTNNPNLNSRLSFYNNESSNNTVRANEMSHRSLI